MHIYRSVSNLFCWVASSEDLPAHTMTRSLELDNQEYGTGKRWSRNFLEYHLLVFIAHWGLCSFFLMRRAALFPRDLSAIFFCHCNSSVCLFWNVLLLYLLIYLFFLWLGDMQWTRRILKFGRLVVTGWHAVSRWIFARFPYNSAWGCADATCTFKAASVFCG